MPFTGSYWYAPKEAPEGFWTEDGTYPSGAAFKILCFGKEKIGKADKVAGGWVPIGCRKVLTLEGAAMAMAKAKLARARQEVKLAEEMIKVLKKGSDKP